MAALLKVSDVDKSFGGVMAVNGMSMDVEAGTIVGLIGPNGAGKSTLLNAINGLYRLDRGQVYLNGQRIDGLPPHQVARRGVGRTFQTPRLFRRLTVLENVLTPVIHRGAVGRQGRRRAMELLDFVGLTEKANSYAQELSGGQQKLLEFARALMSEPELILMDEPFAGVHPTIKETLLNNIHQINVEEGKTILITSHDTPVIAELCAWAVVMHLGSKFLEGPPRDVLSDERLVNVYLGAGSDER